MDHMKRYDIIQASEVPIGDYTVSHILWPYMANLFIGDMDYFRKIRDLSEKFSF